MTGCVCHVRWSPPIPGESAGIPGKASPAASGRSSSSLVIASTGTCPSMAYPSTTAVWQDSASSGTPRSAAVAWRSGSSTTVATAPFCCRYTTHPEQHPQPGSRKTSKVTPVRSAAWSEGGTVGSSLGARVSGCEELPHPTATKTTSARSGSIADLFILIRYINYRYLVLRGRVEPAPGHGLMTVFPVEWPDSIKVMAVGTWSRLNRWPMAGATAWLAR